MSALPAHLGRVMYGVAQLGPELPVGGDAACLDCPWSYRSDSVEPMSDAALHILDRPGHRVEVARRMRAAYAHAGHASPEPGDWRGRWAHLADAREWLDGDGAAVIACLDPPRDRCHRCGACEAHKSYCPHTPGCLACEACDDCAAECAARREDLDCPMLGGQP